MADHDKSLFDRAKDALGMGGDRDHDDDHDHHDEPTDNPRIDKDNLGVDGATQGAGASGAGGGMGATAGLGGAGAGGAADATPDPSKEWSAPADGNRVRTEYEMGHEVDPEHEKVAESGYLAERSGDAVVDTWPGNDEGRKPDDEPETDQPTGTAGADDAPGGTGNRPAGPDYGASPPDDETPPGSQG